MRFFTACFLVLTLSSCTKVFARCSAAFSYTQVTSRTLQFNYVHAANKDSATTFLWAFGDGGSARVEKPLHTFADTGWFKVCLHIGGLNCSSDTCIPVHIVDCRAYFTSVYKPTYMQPEASVYLFTDSSQGEDNTTIYSWAIGGDLSSHKDQVWTFHIDDAGEQSICLTIRNRDNSCKSTYCDTFDIHPLCPGTSFKYKNEKAAYTFYPWTCGHFSKATWDFGDGIIDSASTLADSVVHKYPTTTESYEVCLTIDYECVCTFLAPCTAIYCHTIGAGKKALSKPDR